MNKEIALEEIRLSLRRLKFNPTSAQAARTMDEMNASLDHLMGILPKHRLSFWRRLWAWVRSFKDIF